MARGLGTRMRRVDEATRLDATQAAAADSGVKGMIPIAGTTGDKRARPFLDYVLSSLADVGVSDVVLVLGPEHDAVRDYYARISPPSRVRVRFAMQAEPKGTADAVLAAANVIGDEPFLVLNADNFYPVEALRRLVHAQTAATIAFDRDVLVRDGNIDRERVRSFAVLDVAPEGQLKGIIEKPTRIATRLGIFASVVNALAPKAYEVVMSTAFELFPDSAAAKGDRKGLKDEHASSEQIAFAALMRGVHW